MTDLYLHADRATNMQTFSFFKGLKRKRLLYALSIDKLAGLV